MSAYPLATQFGGLISLSSEMHSSGAILTEASLNKIHPKIEDELQNMRPIRYNRRELAESLERNAKKSLPYYKLTPEEQDILYQEPRWCHTEAEMQKLLQNWYCVLDKLLFFGGVSKAVKKLRTFTEEINVEGEAEIDYGYYLPLDQSINIKFFAGCENSECRPNDYISTLLHEMLHAFLNYYSCRCDECYDQMMIEDGGIKHLTHGSTWSTVMTCIESSLQKAVRWEVDCGIYDCVVDEMERTGWQPTDDMFVQWDMPDFRVIGKGLTHPVEKLGIIHRKNDSRFLVAMKQQTY